jgi:hypothetical protein
MVDGVSGSKTLTSFVEDLSGKRARRGSLGCSSTNSRKSPVRSRRLLRLILVEDAVSVGTFERVDRAQPAAAIVVDPAISAMGDLPAKEDRGCELLATHLLRL